MEYEKIYSLYLPTILVPKYGITVTDNPNSKLTVANYTPNFASSNIGQYKDINTLHKTYKKHISKFPDTDVILYGDSRGAATIFNFITHYINPKRLKLQSLREYLIRYPIVLKHFLYDTRKSRNRRTYAPSFSV